MALVVQHVHHTSVTPVQALISSGTHDAQRQISLVRRYHLRGQREHKPHAFKDMPWVQSVALLGIHPASLQGAKLVYSGANRVSQNSEDTV